MSAASAWVVGVAAAGSSASSAASRIARELVLAARDPLLDRSAAREERAGDLDRAEPAQDVEHECELDLLGEPRLAAREDRAELLVAARRGLERRDDLVLDLRCETVCGRSAASRGGPARTRARHPVRVRRG